MQRFFDSIDTLHAFTLQLDSRPEVVCPHCQCASQLVSHGFAYKKQHLMAPQRVGKRIFCSNRHGKLGCGRTVRLYLAKRIPGLFYCAAVLLAFIRAIISGCAISRAYRNATQCNEARHAYRWLHKLNRAIPDFRARLSRPENILPNSHKRHPILLSTLSSVVAQAKNCAEFQASHQIRFF